MIGIIRVAEIRFTAVAETFDSDECDKNGDRATGVLIETKPLMAWLEGPA